MVEAWIWLIVFVFIVLLAVGLFLLYWFKFRKKAIGTTFVQLQYINTTSFKIIVTADPTDLSTIPTNYTAFISTSSDLSSAQKISSMNPILTYTNAKPNTTYYVNATWSDSQGRTAELGQFNAKITPKTVSAPVLTGVTISNGKFTVSFEPSVEPVEFYTIYYNANGQAINLGDISTFTSKNTPPTLNCSPTSCSFGPLPDGTVTLPTGNTLVVQIAAVLQPDFTLSPLSCMARGPITNNTMFTCS